MKALLPVLSGLISGILIGLAFAGILVEDPTPLMGWVVLAGLLNLCSMAALAISRSGSRRASLVTLSTMGLCFLIAMFGSILIFRA